PDGSGGGFIGGQFAAVGDSLRNNLAHVLADQTVSPWNPGAGAAVHTLMLRNGTLFAGGDFLTLGGVPRNRAGAVDTSTGVPTAWNPNADSSLRALVARPTVIYAPRPLPRNGRPLR